MFHTTLLALLLVTGAAWAAPLDDIRAANAAAASMTAPVAALESTANLPALTRLTTGNLATLFPDALEAFQKSVSAWKQLHDLGSPPDLEAALAAIRKGFLDATKVVQAKAGKVTEAGLKLAKQGPVLQSLGASILDKTASLQTRGTAIDQAASSFDARFALPCGVNLAGRLVGVGRWMAVLGPDAQTLGLALKQLGSDFTKKAPELLRIGSNLSKVFSLPLTLAVTPEQLLRDLQSLIAILTYFDRVMPSLASSLTRVASDLGNTAWNLNDTGAAMIASWQCRSDRLRARHPILAAYVNIPTPMRDAGIRFQAAASSLYAFQRRANDEAAFVRRQRILLQRNLAQLSTFTAEIERLLRFELFPIVGTPERAIYGPKLGGIYSFKGVPFATANRFEAPRAPTVADGVFLATKYGPVCPQNGPAGEGSSENCLSLNVWTPSIEAGAKLPVMVFIHGGAFVAGSASEDEVSVQTADGSAVTVHGELYSGARMARAKNVVVVTIQYRLGVLGFLNGNFGLLDQIAALGWVRENIGGFGGDPRRVTIFGESAGANSVCDLLVMPAARGLFSRAILQSGRCDAVGTAADAAIEAAAFAADLGKDPRAATLAEILATQQTRYHLENGIGLTPLQPFVDGATLPDFPLALIGRGAQHPVPVLMGSNVQEGAGIVPHADFDTMYARAWRFVSDITGPDNASVVLDHYLAGAPDAREAMVQAVTDAVFTCSVRHAGRALARSGTAFHRFRFDHGLNVYGRQTPPTHGMEMFYVFGSIEAMWLSVSPEGIPLTVPIPYQKSDVDTAIETALFDYWTSGQWQPWDPARDNAISFRTADPHVTVEEGIRTDACDFIDGLRR